MVVEGANFIFWIKSLNCSLRKMDLKVSSAVKPARKSLEPSPAAWTRNLPQVYSKYWCELETAPGAAAIEFCRCDTSRSGGERGWQPPLELFPLRLGIPLRSTERPLRSYCSSGERCSTVFPCFLCRG